VHGKKYRGLALLDKRKFDVALSSANFNQIVESAPAFTWIQELSIAIILPGSKFMFSDRVPGHDSITVKNPISASSEIVEFG
jgi:hypothetical protein